MKIFNFLLPLMYLVEAKELNFKCPDVRTCQCRQFPSTGETSLVCASEQDFLTEIMWTTRPETKLDVQCILTYDDNITQSEANNFDFLPKIGLGAIQTFSMKYCPFPESFAKLNGLLGLSSAVEIRLEYVSLREINAGFFGANASTVQELYLLESNVTKVSKLLFDEMINLEVLEISSNRLELMEEQFSALTKLQYLFLQMNKISSLPNNSFDGLDNLIVLDLWSNDLSFLDENIFHALKSLRSLELSNNKLQAIHENLFSSMKELEQISLASNRLSILSKNLFANNNNLKLIRLDNNHLINIPNTLLANKIIIEDVSLYNCSLNTLPQNLFETTQNLINLNLKDNNIKHIPITLFSNLTKLEKLNLENNNVTDVNPASFKHLYSLKELNLAKNEIENISSNTFGASARLKNLDLGYNRIHSMHIQAFVANKELEYVDLSHNSLNLVTVPEELGFVIGERTWFAAQGELKVLNLSHNNITHVLNDIMYKPLMQMLDLSYNQIASVESNDFQTFSSSLTIDLSHNQIKHVNLDDIEHKVTENQQDSAFNTVVELNNNPITCDCYLYDFLRYVDSSMDPIVYTMLKINADHLLCNDPPNLASLTVQEIKPKMVTCEIPLCPDDCFCSFRPYNRAYIVDCAGRNLTEVPKVEQIGFRNIEVYLQNNIFREVSFEDKGYENVTLLDVSNCSISNISKLPRNLKLLYLHNNNISRLSYDVINTLRNVSNQTTLYGNPWRCDCKSLNFSRFINERVDLKLNDLRCDGNGKQIRFLHEKELCPTYEVAILSSLVILISFMAALVLSLAVYYKYTDEIKVWCYANNIFLSCITEEDLDQDKQYDAFISFTHADERYVEDLVIKLESCPKPYKICIHTRNWVIGEYIPKQIAQSVQNSRRTVVVLSQSFKNSVWSKMEFRLAHTQALSEGRARVIVIVKDDVDLEKDVDDELKAYLKTNSYVKAGDPWFWEKLRYALPHRRNGGDVKENNLSISPLVSKINPLKFKDSQTGLIL